MIGPPACDGAIPARHDGFRSNGETAEQLSRNVLTEKKMVGRRGLERPVKRVRISFFYVNIVLACAINL